MPLLSFSRQSFSTFRAAHSPRVSFRRAPAAWCWAAAFIFAVLMALPAGAAPVEAVPTPALWDLKALSAPPKTFPAPEVKRDGVRSLFYQGLPYRGRPTRVFAFYGAPPQAGPQTRVPAVVLVHGGGGTAFETWVRLWNSRGYAAIAMDLCGCLPVGSPHKFSGPWPRHADGGPAGWGGFTQIDEPQTDQWTYHAIAGVILAHSLLRSFPEVDSARIGVTGISWGGYLTCIAAGVDPRFRCAVPVYGCGFLGDNSVWLKDFANLGASRAARWLGWWDPSRYLPQASCPMLWVDGTNDFAYPMDSLQKSYRLPSGPRTLCLRVRMPHGHGGAGENPEEIHAFMDQYLKGGDPLARVTGQGRKGLEVWATFKSPTPLAKAELNFTRAGGPWKERLWETVPAHLDAVASRVSARLPEGVTVYYLNLIDSHGLPVSAEHEVLPVH